MMTFEPYRISKADINIFNEHVRPELFGYANENWLIPNVEWFFGHWNQFLPYFRRILLKTPHAKSVMACLSPESLGQMKVVGFESRDLYRPEIKKERKFLHLAGKSSHKNTQSVVLAWMLAKPDAQLTVISEHQEKLDVPNVTFHNRVSEEDLIRMMNEHLFHLIPSAYEGWGHAIHEGMGCGAIILTTANPPMCQWGPQELLIGGWQDKMHHQVLLTKVDPREVLRSVQKAMKLSDERCVELTLEARGNFLADNKRFRENLTEIFREYANL